MTRKKEYWKQICNQFINSGLTKAEFCKQNNIIMGTFYGYLHHFAPEQIKSPTRLICNDDKKITSFIPVKYTAPQEKHFKISLRSGLTISFDLIPSELPTFIKQIESSYESSL